jgi:hypothetical protein
MNGLGREGVWVAIGLLSIAVPIVRADGLAIAAGVVR